ncbi:hypothetical protein ACJX0J_008026, partial [Zea mays]
SDGIFSNLKSILIYHYLFEHKHKTAISFNPFIDTSYMHIAMVRATTISFLLNLEDEGALVYTFYLAIVSSAGSQSGFEEAIKYSVVIILLTLHLIEYILPAAPFRLGMFMLFICNCSCCPTLILGSAAKHFFGFIIEQFNNCYVMLASEEVKTDGLSLIF